MSAPNPRTMHQPQRIPEGALVLAGEPHQDVAADVKVVSQTFTRPRTDLGEEIGRAHV